MHTDREERRDAAPPRRSRRWRWLLVVLGLLILLLILLPMVASRLARSWLTNAWAQRHDARCTIDSLELGYTGVRIQGLQVRNPPGFDESRPLLSLEHMSGSFSWLALLSGRVELRGQVRGLELFVDADDDGASNVAVVFGAAGAAARRRGPGLPDVQRAPDDDTDDLDRLDIDLVVADSRVEIRRAGELVEAIGDIEARVYKPYGVRRFLLEVGARLAPLRGGDAAGALRARAEVDPAERRATATFSSQGLDLQRYAAVLGSLAPQQLTSLAGVVDGELVLRAEQRDGDQFVALDGELVVAGPRLSGPLVAGMDLRAARWLLRPDIALRTEGGQAEVDRATLRVDLGFLEADLGLVPGAATATLGGSYRVDLEQLRGFGGAPAAAMADAVARGGTLAGSVALPLAALLPQWPAAADREGLSPADLLAALLAAAPDRDALLAALQVEAAVRSAAVHVPGFDAPALDLELALAEGRVALRTGGQTAVNGGPLQLALGCQLTAAELPFELEVGWRGGRVDGAATPALRYALPLLAGLEPGRGGLSALLDLQLSVRGPLRRPQGSDVLGWLGRFSGEGELALADGSLLPAPELRPLLQLLDQQQRLSLDRYGGSFRIREGALQTTAMRWLSKGREYGLVGTVGFDGALDFGLDLTALLEQHRDGRVIRRFLGEQKLLAGLGGTLDAPRLTTPDLAGLLQRALQQAPQRLLEEQGRSFLERLLGGRGKQ